MGAQEVKAVVSSLARALGAYVAQEPAIVLEARHTGARRTRDRDAGFIHHPVAKSKCGTAFYSYGKACADVLTANGWDMQFDDCAHAKKGSLAAFRTAERSRRDSRRAKETEAGWLRR